MNRPYFDVVDTLFVECAVCHSFILYTHRAISHHEENCSVPDGFDAKMSKTGDKRTAPPPPRGVT